MKVILKNIDKNKCSFEGYFFSYHSSHVFNEIFNTIETYKGKYFINYDSAGFLRTKELSVYYADFFSYLFYSLDGMK